MARIEMPTRLGKGCWWQNLIYTRVGFSEGKNSTTLGSYWT